MAKTSFKKQINELHNMTKKMPSLMETIEFNHNLREDDDMEYDEMPEEEPHMEEPHMEEPRMSMEMPHRGKEVVDQIRKMALKAMAELADNTEDSYYSVLKRIWQMADKNPAEDKNKKMIE